MFCPNCGKEIPENMKFCNYCGTPQSVDFTRGEQAEQQNVETYTPPNARPVYQASPSPKRKKSKATKIIVSIVVVVVVFIIGYFATGPNKLKQPTAFDTSNEFQFVCGADLCQTDCGRNDRLHHGQSLSEILPDGIDNILTEVGFVGHGQKYAADFQPGVDLPADALNGADKLRHVLCGQIVRLHGNQHIVRSGKGIDDQHTEGRATVQQHIVIVFFDTFYILAQHRFPAHGIDQPHLHSGQGAVAGDKIKALIVMQDLCVIFDADTGYNVVHNIAQSQRQLMRFRGSIPKFV